jgi:hypothetical protein
VTNTAVGVTRSGQSDVVSSTMVTLGTGRIWDAARTSDRRRDQIAQDDP